MMVPLILYRVPNSRVQQLIHLCSDIIIDKSDSVYHTGSFFIMLCLYMQQQPRRCVHVFAFGNRSAYKITKVPLLSHVEVTLISFCVQPQVRTTHPVHMYYVMANLIHWQSVGNILHARYQCNQLYRVSVSSRRPFKWLIHFYGSDFKKTFSIQDPHLLSSQDVLLYVPTNVSIRYWRTDWVS